MISRELRSFVIAIGLFSFLISGCGGGSAGSGGPTTASPPSFTIYLSPASVTLTQGGPSQAIQVTVNAQNGFSGSVSVTPPTLPSGVTVSPASLSLTPGSPGNFTLSASSNAVLSQQSVTVNAASGTLTAKASLQLSVNGAPMARLFYPIGGSLVHGFYDEARQLLFAANPGLNELDVISGKDFSIKARVTVPQPWGIDQMADGKTLVLGTQAQEIITVDEETLAVTQHPYTAKGSTFFTLFFPNVVALANGKVIVIASEQGVESNDILDGGQYLYEWDSNANTFSQLEPTGSPLISTWETDSLARSADHKWAIFSGDQFYLYSSDSDSLTSVPASTVNPPNNLYGIRGYALNPDGTKIAVASAEQVTFLDRSFNVLGSTSIPTAFATARTAVQFSLDGQKLFLQYDLPINIEEIDANSYAALGSVSGAMHSEDNLERMLTTDSQGRAYVGNMSGLRLVDLTQTPVPNASNGIPADPQCPFLNVALPLNTAQQLQLPIPIFPNISIYIGGQPAPLQNGGTNIDIPASSVPGPADIQCVDASGNTTVTPNGVSYGVDPVSLSANLLTSSGSSSAYLFGFGFSANQNETPSVTVAGQAAKVTSLDDYGSYQAEQLKIPAGTPGERADIEVSSSVGMGALTGTAIYASSTILPAAGLLQLTYDSHRSVLYALKSGEVDVLNASTLQWQSPMPFPAAAVGGTFNTMALTPDGSKLVIAGSSGTGHIQVIVFDPDNPSGAAVLTSNAATSGYQNGSIAISKFNKVILNGPSAIELDLSTSTFSPLNVNMGQLVRSSADGSHLYGVDLNDSGGEVYSIDTSTYSVQSTRFGYLFWTDLAVSTDGSQFAAINAPPYATGDLIGYFNSSAQFLNLNEYPYLSPPDDLGVLGATYSPGGQVIVMPLGDSIEFWDSVKGTLRARLTSPEELRVIAYPEGAVSPVMALDSKGQTIFAISASGVTVLTLMEPMDQMTPAQWSYSLQSASTRLGGSSAFQGMLASRMAARRAMISGHVNASSPLK